MVRFYRSRIYNIQDCYENYIRNPMYDKTIFYYVSHKFHHAVCSIRAHGHPSGLSLAIGRPHMERGVMKVSLAKTQCKTVKRWKCRKYSIYLSPQKLLSELTMQIRLARPCIRTTCTFHFPTPSISFPYLSQMLFGKTTKSVNGYTAIPAL